MLPKVKRVINQLHPQRVSSVLAVFLKDESLSGKFILLAAALSLVVVNSPLQEIYDHFWHLPLSVGIGSWALSLDLREWVNEGLMALFFLVVGLEIKRELVKGELRDIKTALLPIGAAVGGMVVPAVIYILWNGSGDALRGWGIPIATDIAFAVAILALLGPRIPVGLKVFLLTLAIADDIGAITIIALFYAEIIHMGFLAASVAIVAGMVLLRKFLVRYLPLVVIAGVALWFCAHMSGIHASVVGAILGLIAPVGVHKYRISKPEQIEKFLLPLTTFVVLPVFIFANAGFVISLSSLGGNEPVVWGIISGLVVGKVVGITLASWLLVRTNIARLPAGVSWQHIIGVGFVAGIGFTVSIFMTELAFGDNRQLVDAAKIGIFIASALSALIGTLVLLVSHRRLKA